jgi:hypothetical protein
MKVQTKGKDAHSVLPNRVPPTHLQDKHRNLAEEMPKVCIGLEEQTWHPVTERLGVHPKNPKMQEEFIF